jgi:hypothetical protein
MTHETLCADWTDAERSAEMHIYRRGPRRGRDRLLAGRQRQPRTPEFHWSFGGALPAGSEQEKNLVLVLLATVQLTENDDDHTRDRNT